MNWHSLSIEEVLEKFNINPKIGVTDSRIGELRVQYGENRILAQHQKSGFKLLLEQFNNPVIIILIFAAIFTAIAQDYKDTIVIAVVVILNTVIGYIQERRASDALKALSKMAAPNARVIRNGLQQQIPTGEVVCGDIIVLESGMRASADARLVDSHNLVVDESMLTGESFPAQKKHKAVLHKDFPLGDRINMIYAGTIIQKGRAIAIVTEVGIKTEFGKISQQVTEAVEATSPLQKKIAQFGKWLSLAIITIIAVIFIVGFLKGNDLLVMFLTSVGLAVSAIPEGLPVAVTITLSIGIYQMAKHKAVVKKLAAVETLGSTNVICTDKTGTLTKNQMIVNKLIIGNEEFEVSGVGYAISGDITSLKTGEKIKCGENKAMEMACIAGNLCTESVITLKGDEWEITGDPTEAAIMIAFRKLGMPLENWDVSIDIPFESENQLMAVKAIKGDKAYSLAKGAPEKILRRCSSMINQNGEKVPVDLDYLTNEIAELSEKGLRVLAIAYAETEIDIELNLETLYELSLVGLAGIEDSVRPEAIDAVRECRNAGVRVVMITGDHIQTAKAVASTVGISMDKEIPIAITGVELDKISDEELYNRVSEIDVYARVAPNHKFRIVKQLQRHNHIIAMTGDGVNDAPALKQADIGVAMGSGTDVAKEAAHMVLMDDNFATIVKAIRRGRVILNNLQHILLYILSTSAGGLLTIAASVALGFPLPLLPAQLLWINLVTDGTSTFPLAFEKEHGDVMVFAPRERDAPLITKRMVGRIIVAGLIMMIGTLAAFYFSLTDSMAEFFAINFHDPDLEKSRTIAFCVLAFFQIWNVQNSRSVDRSLFFNLPHPKMYEPKYFGKEKFDRMSPNQNPLLLGVMTLAILLQVAAVEVPFMNMILDTVPLLLTEWLMVLSLSFSIIIIIEMVKFFTMHIETAKAKKRQHQFT